MKRIAIFISVDSFETWFGGVFGLTRDAYVNCYRNDWVWEYASGLAGLGHEIAIYVLSRGRAERREALPGVSVRFVALAKWHRFVDAFLYRVRLWPGMAQLRARIEFQAFSASLIRGLRDDRIDVLYNQEFWTPRFDMLVDHLSAPIVGADHGGRYDGRRRTKQRTLKQARTLVCQTVEQLELVRALGADAVLITNGVDTKFFCPPPEGSERGAHILAVGRLSDRQKRFSDLIRAMKYLPEFRLSIVGSGEDEAALRRLVSALDLGERIEFLGFVSDRTHLRNLYRTCGVFASPSAWEAMALVVLEAMSCGAPVAATRIPTFKALIEDGTNGFLAPVGSPEQMSGAIRRAYHAGRSVGEKARETIVQRFAAELIYRQVSDLIEAV
jgi:glycosyltransferase involved in cell wall biosynthesis